MNGSMQESIVLLNGKLANYVETLYTSFDGKKYRVKKTNVTTKKKKRK